MNRDGISSIIQIVIASNAYSHIFSYNFSVFPPRHLPLSALALVKLNPLLNRNVLESIALYLSNMYEINSFFPA